LTRPVGATDVARSIDFPIALGTSNGPADSGRAPARVGLARAPAA
jgi:hypothetical protein